MFFFNVLASIFYFTLTPGMLSFLLFASFLLLNTLLKRMQGGANCLPCICCGPAIECDGCSICNVQGQMCCVVLSAAFPCNNEVPVACTVMGMTMYPKCGCCVPQKEIMNRSSLCGVLRLNVGRAFELTSITFFR